MPGGGSPSALLICRVSASRRDADPNRPGCKPPSPETLSVDCSTPATAGEALYGGAKGSSGGALLCPGLLKGFDAGLRAGLETGLDIGLGYSSGSENV